MKVKILIIALVIIAAMGFLGFKYQVQIQAFIQTPEVVKSTRPFYIPLDKMVVSVESERTIYYVMMEVTLETKLEASIEGINYYMPVIRNSFVRNLSQRSYDTIRKNLKNIEQLQIEMLSGLDKELTRYEMNGIIDDVLITKLVVQ
ncbi:flagellar basal body-associated FliL family protein [Moritella sp.]|uniref:flagellar basal body-associated FliL family protein n=1 Tax=Moritella sp. TaxID=78556 RepID=UPI001D4BD94E|nr:flagellar basal body-associated FliL family protein [Moritella sp.]MCJ8349473.1 flagellar basal body-associated FliL family protein [Moritella sp.]NQZ39212.1 flagellar basal body-associated FliL family protein [Moritella sp.]